MWRQGAFFFSFIQPEPAIMVYMCPDFVEEQFLFGF